MNSYILTSNKFDGSIRVGYGTKGYLTDFSFKDASLNVGTWKWFIMNLPVKESDIELLRPQGVNAQLVPPDLSFEAFWELYDYRVSKNKTQKIWNKLTDTDKTLILEAVPKYKRWLKKKGTIEQLYPSTYINKDNERWTDQY